MGIAASAALHGGAALIVLAALSLVGYASLAVGRWRLAVASIPASLAVGSLVVGWTAFLAGTFLGTPAILPLFALFVALSLFRSRAWGRDAVRCARRVAALARANPVGAAALVLVLAMVVPQLLLPLVDSDGLTYHVGQPKLFVLTGRVSFVPWTFTSSLVETVEMIYLIGFRIAGGETAKFLHFGYFLASLATLGLAVHRSRRTRPAAMLAALLYAASPVALAPAGAAFSDHAAMFFILTGALVLFRRRSAVVAGLALGAAMATKMIVAPAIAGAMLARGRKLLVMAVPVVVAFLPFAIRNIHYTGDPIYPIGYILLHRPVPGLLPDRMAFYGHYHSDVPGVLGIAWSPDPEHVQIDDVAGLHHAAGLLAIALAIRFPWTRRWLALVLPGLALALAFQPPTRHLLPMFAGLAALEAYALVLLVRRFAPLVAVVAVIPALVAAALTLLTAFRPADYLLGRIDREQFLATRLPGYRAAQLVNRQPPGGWVMALDFPAPYYFDRPWIAEGVMNPPPLQQWIAEARTADDVLRRLHAADVRYLVVTPGYGGGTRAALLPLARNRREAEIIVALRRRLALIGTVDRVDVLFVGR